MAKRKRNAEKGAKRSGKLTSFFVRVKDSLLEAVFPRDLTCDVCGEELCTESRYLLCGDCLEALPAVGEHACLVCGTQIADEADICIRCQNQKYDFVRNHAPLVYDGIARKLIYGLKFGGKKYLADTLGAMMSDEFLKRSMNADIAVFVPMTQSEEKKRGYNQSELLAREVGRRLNMPVLPALVKVRETSAQKELNRDERAENLNKAFACVFSEIKGRSILLVDDVFTTGATANACTQALLKGGAREVSVLTFAVTKLKIPVESADGTVAI